jgi:hypothetical protein
VLVALAPTVISARVQLAYRDPSAYCAADVTIDPPDARYTRPQISDNIINGFIAMTGREECPEPDLTTKPTDDQMPC